MPISIPKYMSEGFTITQWVRFQDHVNSGTLFNYGDPTRDTDPHGYKLETYVIPKEGDGSISEPPPGFFTNFDYERFVRLVVHEPDPNVDGGVLRDSHAGSPGGDNDIDGFARISTLQSGIPSIDNNTTAPGLFTATHVPDAHLQTEWYFVTATYNPNVNEAQSVADVINDYTNYSSPDSGITFLKDDPFFWKGKITPVHSADGTYTSFSGLGARCKVDIISRTDLIRARGFKPIESST